MTVATTEEAAAVDFEPLSMGEPDWSLFSPQLLEAHKLAWTILRKTKPELTAMAVKLDDQAGNAMLDTLSDAVETCAADLKTLVSALTRMMVVAAAIAQRDR